MAKKRNKKQKVKVIYVDDGRTIFDMSGVERPNMFGSPSCGKDKATNKETKKKKTQTPVGLSRKERWAAIKAAYAAYLPVLFIIILAFLLTMVLMAILFR